MSMIERTQELIRSKKSCYSVSGCRFDPSKGRLHAFHARHCFGTGLA